MIKNIHECNIVIKYGPTYFLYQLLEKGNNDQKAKF